MVMMMMMVVGYRAHLTPDYASSLAGTLWRSLEDWGLALARYGKCYTLLGGFLID